MNAIKAIRKRLEKNPDAPSSKALAHLVAALVEEKSFSLAELALELLKDWRLDRYYAAKLKLYDFALSAVIPEKPAQPPAPEPPPG